ncbi:MAG: hypothetical protein AAGI90_04865 [Chlamydiota bacterium]
MFASSAHSLPLTVSRATKATYFPTLWSTFSLKENSSCWQKTQNIGLIATIVFPVFIILYDLGKHLGGFCYRLFQKNPTQPAITHSTQEPSLSPKKVTIEKQPQDTQSKTVVIETTAQKQRTKATVTPKAIQLESPKNPLKDELSRLHVLKRKLEKDLEDNHKTTEKLKKELKNHAKELHQVKQALEKAEEAQNTKKDVEDNHETIKELETRLANAERLKYTTQTYLDDTNKRLDSANEEIKNLIATKTDLSKTASKREKVIDVLKNELMATKSSESAQREKIKRLEKAVQEARKTTVQKLAATPPLGITHFVDTNNLQAQLYLRLSHFVQALNVNHDLVKNDFKEAYRILISNKTIDSLKQQAKDSPQVVELLCNLDTFLHEYAYACRELSKFPTGLNYIHCMNTEILLPVLRAIEGMITPNNEPLISTLEMLASQYKDNRVKYVAWSAYVKCGANMISFGQFLTSLKQAAKIRLPKTEISNFDAQGALLSVLNSLPTAILLYVLVMIVHSIDFDYYPVVIPTIITGLAAIANASENVRKELGAFTKKSITMAYNHPRSALGIFTFMTTNYFCKWNLLTNLGRVQKFLGLRVTYLSPSAEFNDTINTRIDRVRRFIPLAYLLYCMYQGKSTIQNTNLYERVSQGVRKELKNPQMKKDHHKYYNYKEKRLYDTSDEQKKQPSKAPQARAPSLGLPAPGAPAHSQPESPRSQPESPRPEQVQPLLLQIGM